MATNIPGGRRQRLEWIEGLITQWGDNQTLLGLTSAQVIELGTDIANARQAFTSVEAIRANSKSETNDYYTKADGVHKLASEMLKVIKGTAATSDTPSAIYLAAGITPQDPPSPAPAPTLPSIDSAAINSNGAVTLDFSAIGPTGTVWQISRKLAGETTFAIIGNADPDTKAYLDSTVPAGTTVATYRVGGVRGGLAGPQSVNFTVQLGAADAAASEAA